MSNKGTCLLCGFYGSKAGMTQHLKKCIPKSDPPNGEPSHLFHLRVEAQYNPIYWLNLEIRSDAKLTDLDYFLRDIWLECCGHLSVFRFGEVSYVTPSESGFDPWPELRTMDTRVAELLRPVGKRFNHEYDFGSTTTLSLCVQGEREGTIGKPAIRLLARNEAPRWQCAICSKPATLICSFCVEDQFYCDRHARRHACYDDGGFLPIVNTPRMGVCGYGD